MLVLTFNFLKIQDMKEQFRDVENLIQSLQSNILEPECKAALDQNYYTTVLFSQLMQFFKFFVPTLDSV